MNTYVFTVSGITASPSAGDTYTNNGHTFTVVNVSIVGGAGTITTTGAGEPTSSGTLVRAASDEGNANISFSAYTLSACYSIKDKGNISLKGGGVLKAIEVDDAGNVLHGNGSAIDLGYIETSGIQLATSGDKTVYDETGEALFYDEGETSVKITGTFLQTNKDLLDFLRDSTSGRYYMIYLKMSRKNEMNGKTQELFGVVGRFKKQFDVKAATKKIPFEITLFPSPVSCLAIMGLQTYFGSVANIIPLGNGSPYQIIETTEA